MAFEIKVVSIKSVTKQGQSGDYTYSELGYEYKGQAGTMNVFPSTLKKYEGLESAYKQLKVGDVVKINKSDNGKGFKELSEIIALTSSNNNTSSTGKSNKSVGSNQDDYAIGQQVGNAITNACSTLKSGSTIKQIETRVWEIILLGGRVKDKIKAGDHLKDNETPDRDVSLEEQQQIQDPIDDDLPF